MPYSDQTKRTSTAKAVPVAPDLGEDWLDIGDEPGLPGRQAVLAWSDHHSLAVVVGGCVAVSVPLIAALWFG